jgi:ABC-type multidrug transport system fused ATPase/permease subunit
VAFLLEKFGTSAFRQVLRSYDPDRRDQASLTAYERTLAGLEEAWLASLRRSGGTAVLRSFFRHVVPLLRPYWPRELEVLGYMLVEMLYGLAIPLSSKWLVDTVIPARSVQLLLFFVLALLGMYVLDALIGMRRVYVSESINQRLLMNLQERMFSHLQRLPHAFYSEAKVGDIMSRLTHDVFSVEAALAQVTGVGVFLGLKALVTAVVLIVLSPILGAVVLFVVPLFAVSYFVLRSKLQTASYEAQKVAGEVASVTQENLSAHPVVKAFGLEGRAVASYHARLLSAFKVGLRLTMIGALFETSMGLATTFGQLVVLGVGGYLIITGHITVGTLLAFIGLLASLFIPIAMLSSAGHTLQSASGALDRVSELLEAPVSITDAEAAVPLPPLTREIRLEHVTFGYASPRAVLVDVTLTIPAGRHIAIVGPSGSGKSTLVNLLLRFWDVGEGAILADGQDIRGVSLESLRGQIGVVFQDTFVFDTTVRENIGIGRLGASDEEVVATAKAAQLDSYVDSLPAGYDTVLGERGVRMSGGQRQRLAIARALLRDPRILILDEATSALDAQTESEILESLMRLASGRTTISVTHRLSLAALADHIFVLDQGRLVEEGPHGELVKAGGLYQRLYQEQMRHVLGGGRFGSIDAAHLRAVPLFKDLSDQAMATVASRMRLERHPANYDVVRQGDPGDKFYVIGSGKVEVLIHDHTGERRINTLTGDEYFGEMALLTGESRTATVRTTIPTELYSLSRADFMELLEQDPAIYRAAGAMLASRRAALGTAAAGMGTTSS